MRFDKRSRRIRPKRKKKAAGKNRPSAGVPFWIYLAGGLALLGVFYFAIYRSHETQLRKSRREKIREDMDRICTAAILHFQAHGRYPATLEELLSPQAPDNQGAESDLHPADRLLERLPVDPWGRPYVYRAPEGEAPLALISWGQDGEPGGRGEAKDVIREGCRSSGLGEP